MLRNIAALGGDKLFRKIQTRPNKHTRQADKPDRQEQTDTDQTASQTYRHTRHTGKGGRPDRQTRADRQTMQAGETDRLV